LAKPSFLKRGPLRMIQNEKRLPVKAFTPLEIMPRWNF